VIDHPAGEQTQWDWVELPDPPPGWGWGKTAHLLVGALSHSGRCRGVLCESKDQPHLIDGLDRITRALGGVSRHWRFDQMATVVSPGHGPGQCQFRCRREALRCRCSTVPSSPGGPRGSRGEGQPSGCATVLADAGRRRQHRGRAGAPGHLVARHGDTRVRSAPGGLGTAPTRSAMSTC
jgi:hypothetical protein